MPDEQYNTPEHLHSVNILLGMELSSVRGFGPSPVSRFPWFFAFFLPTTVPLFFASPATNTPGATGATAWIQATTGWPAKTGGQCNFPYRFSSPVAVSRHMVGGTCGIEAMTITGSDCGIISYLHSTLLPVTHSAPVVKVRLPFLLL